ncbi:hypothetical protein ASC66_13270 [Leifsonia sp. Root4]|uniref:PH-like domain-containing protein n=1 Tax=Leifsonia sp. Root4 TaxID=1736525 RepID=UPI0006FFA734|nr:hypothetical protein [Leifsonia sp. Root4]KQW05907.1 hypothetical protein ASC66_13270 [Leifsonia sp. Root4]
MSVERTLLAALLAVVVLALLLLMLRSWKRRGNRDNGLSAYAVPAAPAEQTLVVPVAYVATTKHELPLERLLPAGLRFRAQGTLAVASDGLTIDLAGGDALFIPRSALREVSETTWAIDRAVESDGLSCVSWLMQRTPDASEQTDTIADSFFRVIDPAQRAVLVSAISTLLPATAAGANSEAQK